MIRYADISKEFKIPEATLKVWNKEGWLDRRSLELAAASIADNGRETRLPNHYRPSHVIETPEPILMTIRGTSLDGGEQSIVCTTPAQVKAWSDVQSKLASADNARAQADKARYGNDEYRNDLVDALVTSAANVFDEVLTSRLEQIWGKDLIDELRATSDPDEWTGILDRASVTYSMELSNLAQVQIVDMLRDRAVLAISDVK